MLRQSLRNDNPCWQVGKPKTYNRTLTLKRAVASVRFGKNRHCEPKEVRRGNPIYLDCFTFVRNGYIKTEDLKVFRCIFGLLRILLKARLRRQMLVMIIKSKSSNHNIFCIVIRRSNQINLTKQTYL